MVWDHADNIMLNWMVRKIQYINADKWLEMTRPYLIYDTVGPGVHTTTMHQTFRKLTLNTQDEQ